MKKTIIFSLLTSVIIGISIFATSHFLSFSFNEWNFMISLALFILILFFSSSGGMLSKMTTFEASQSVWKIQKNEEEKIHTSFVFFGSLLYSIGSLIHMLIIY